MPFFGSLTNLVAGGLTFTKEHDERYWTLVGLEQGDPVDAIFELEMHIVADPLAPAVPSPFTVSNNGAALHATLNWINPTTTENGNLLTTIDSVVVWREFTHLTTITTTTPGAPLVYNDLAVPDTGYYNYKAICSDPLMWKIPMSARNRVGPISK